MMGAAHTSVVRAVIVVVGVFLMLLAVAMNAHAASQLGQVAPADSVSSAVNDVSYLQFTDTGSPSYRASEPSVITRWGFREGSVAGVNNSMALQIWRPAAGVNYTLAYQSPTTALLGLANQVREVDTRVPMQTGDVIGMRAVTFGGNNPITYDSPSGNSIGFMLGFPNVGETFSPLTANLLRLNLYATIEPDADNDGYGDESQDTCPGDPTVGSGPCSGQLIGPDVGLRRSGWSLCVSGCLTMPTEVSGGQATTQSGGVIVRWRFKSNAGSDAYRLRIIEPLLGGEIRALSSSPPLNAPGIEDVIVHSGPTRIPIPPGGAIALDTPPGSNAPFVSGAGNAMSQFDYPLADGATAMPISLWDGSVTMVSADVEPDADGDGFGDISQDQCVGNGAVTGVCPPTLAAVKSSNKKFRVNTKGAVISAAKRGTTLSYTLGGAAANVQITVQRVVKGRKRGAKCVKQSRSNKRRKSCNRYVKVHEFSRDAVVGANSVVYSGRYKRGSRNRKLTPGRYRFALTATNASGNAAAVSMTVRVVKR